MIDEAFRDLEPWGYGAEHESPIHVYGVELALPLLVVAILTVASLAQRRRARQAAAVERTATAPSALAPGEAVVCGVVAGVDGEAAVRVTVEQVGVETRAKNGWTSKWTEVARRTEARPFDLVRADGSRLPVQPGEAPRLLDDLGPWVRDEHTLRTATASLVEGETVYARGEIVQRADPRGGYRGGTSLVLRSPAGEPMTLSTLGLAAPARALARRRQRWAVAIVIATLLAQMMALPYYVSLLAGETRSATIVSRRTVEGSGSKDPDTHFVRYRLEGSGSIVEDEVTAEDLARLPEGQIVPVRVSPLETTLGPHPTIHGLLILLPSFALLALCGVALWSSFRRWAWYERRLVEKVNGRLGGDAPATSA